MCVQLESVPSVELANGTWKYVQIELRLGPLASEGEARPATSAAANRFVSVRIVRSFAGVKYHADAYR